MNMRIRSLFNKLFKNMNLDAKATEANQSDQPLDRPLVNDSRSEILNGFRNYLSKPLFPIAAIILLAIGVSLNVAFFTFLNGVVFRPLSVNDPEQLYEVVGRNERNRRLESYSFKEYNDLRDKNQVFQELGAERLFHVNISSGRLNSYLVSGNYFDAVGARALLGRPIRPEDDQPSSQPVVVLSHTAWQRHYEADPQIVGKQIELATRPFTVIGVMSKEFEGFDPATADLWTPLRTRDLFTGEKYLTDPTDLWLRVIGRLKPGLTSEQAKAFLDTNLPGITQSRHKDLVAVRTYLKPLATYQHWADFPWLGMGPIILIFLLVFFIACGNIAIMLTARIIAGRRKLAERLSLEGGRGPVVRQLAIEILPLIILGGALGLVFSRWLLSILRNSILYPEFAESRFFNTTFDIRIFIYTLFLSLLAYLIIGFIPALRVTRSGFLTAPARNQGIVRRKERLRNSLVVVQFSLILVLLSVAGSLIRHQMKLSLTNLGFDTSHVLFVGLERGATRLDLWNKLSEIPGIVSFSTQMVEPLHNIARPASVLLDGQGSSQFTAGFNVVSPDYFKTLNIPILRGRVFTLEEAGANAGVALVSQATAQRFWPGQDPIGKQFTANVNPPRVVQVIGVTGGAINKMPLDGVDSNFFYLPINPSLPSNRFLARVEGDPEQMQQTVRAAITSAFPIAEFEVLALKEWISRGYYQHQVFSWVATAIGLFCLILASIGVYGSITQLVYLRNATVSGHESLEEKQALQKPILQAGYRMIAISIVCGLVFILGASYLLMDPVICSHMTDPLVLFVVVALFVAVSLIALYLSIRKPRLTDPKLPLPFEKMQPSPTK